MFGFFLYRDSRKKGNNSFRAFCVTLASRRVEKSSTRVGVSLGKINCVQVMQGFRIKIPAKNNYLSGGSILGSTILQTALFCCSQTTNRFRFLLKTETVWLYSSTNITITDSFNNISHISYYMLTQQSYFSSQITRY